MSFEKAFNTLQTNTEQIWKYFDRYDGQTLNLSPAPGKWSALQHLVHINKAERSFVILLSKALRSNQPLNGSPMKTVFRSLLFKAYLNFGVKLKSPKVIEPAIENFELEVLKKDFEKTRQQLKQLFESVTPEQWPLFWVNHIYLKELRVKDLLEFLTFHQNHHFKLVRRYLK